MKKFALSLLVVCIALFTTSLVLANELTVNDPWIREAPPEAQMLAAYMTIGNNSTHTVALESASSPDFRIIEIHRTKMEKGMARMMRQSRLQILPGSRVVLAPGNYHLMLMQPLRSLRAGDTVQLQLRFDSGESIDVTALVRKGDR